MRGFGVNVSLIFLAFFLPALLFGALFFVQKRDAEKARRVINILLKW